MVDVSHLRRDPDSPFTTPSDVLAALNAALQRNAVDDGDGVEGDGRFELHARLPDGGSRPATAAEARAADADSRLRQVRHHLRDLTPAERAAWAAAERRRGNALYAQGDFQAAADVYLALLPVAAETEGGAAADPALLAGVLGNLAQATLRLGQYRRTVALCTLALERLGAEEGDGATGTAGARGDIGPTAAVRVAKLLFRRAKARRLAGAYTEARTDLRRAAEWLRRPPTAASSGPAESGCSSGSEADAELEAPGGSLGDEGDADATDKGAAHCALLKSLATEEQLLDRAAREGKRNEDRTRRAMQKLLWSPPAPPLPKDRTDENHSITDHPNAQPIHERNDSPGGEQQLYPESAARNFSTLRATRPSLTINRKRNSDKDCGDDCSLEGSELSYFQWYMAVLGRVAERLLILMGDEEWVRNHREKRE